MPDVRKATGTRSPARKQFTKPGVSYPTPDTTNDYIIIERKDVDSKEQPIAYGTAHPLAAVSAAKLIDQSFEGEENGKKNRTRIYAKYGTAAEQDVYNAARSYSGESNSHQILVRGYTLPRAGYAPLTKGTADTVLSAAKLVKEDAAPFDGDNLNFRVIRIFEVLPGPYLPFTRYDDDLGPIQGRRRAVLNTGQAATLTATTRTTYEARDGSSIVSWEIEETWSNGTGSAGNPAYPIGVTDIYDPERGAVQITTQLVVKTGNEVGSLVNTDGTITETKYEPYNEFLLRCSVEIWVIASAPVLEKDAYDTERGAVKVTTQLILYVANDAGTLTNSGGGITETSYDPINAVVSRRTIQSWVIASAPQLSGQDYDETYGVVIPYTQQIKLAGTELAHGDKTPLDVLTSRFKEFNRDAIRAALLEVYWTYPGRESISLPDKLVTATVVWSIDQNDGAETVAVDPSYTCTPGGCVGPLQRATATAGASVSGALSAKTKQGYQGPIPAVYHVFFLDADTASDGDVLGKTGSVAWPFFRLESEQVVVRGYSKSVQTTKAIRKSVSIDGSGASVTDMGSGTSRRGGTDIRVFDLPPTLHGAVTIGELGTSTATATATSTAGSLSVTQTVSVTGSVSPTSLGATSPTTFPTGTFLVRAEMSPYDYGLVKVMAITVEITGAYV